MFATSHPYKISTWHSCKHVIWWSCISLFKVGISCDVMYTYNFTRLSITFYYSIEVYNKGHWFKSLYDYLMIHTHTYIDIYIDMQFCINVHDSLYTTLQNSHTWSSTWNFCVYSEESSRSRSTPKALILGLTPSPIFAQKNVLFSWIYWSIFIASSSINKSKIDTIDYHFRSMMRYFEGKNHIHKFPRWRACIHQHEVKWEYI